MSGMTPQQEELKRRIQLVKQNIKTLRHESARLAESCTHYLEPLEQNDYRSREAQCEICKKDLGWRCQKSPDTVCHYPFEICEGEIELIDGTVYKFTGQTGEHDCCIFCGVCEERK